MIKMGWLFIILLVSAWLGTHLQADPGYVLVVYKSWTAETTLWVAGIGLIVAYIMLHGFFSLLGWVSTRPSTFMHWRAKRRALSSQKKTRQGLIEFSEGHWARAKNYLIKALPDADTPLLNYLTAARAAQEMGDYQLRDQFLREAQQCMPEAKIAVELTQAQLQLANRQWEQALATLRHLQDIAPGHAYVLKLLSDLYQEVKDWTLLIGLLPDLKRHQVVTGAAYDALQHQAYLQAFLDLLKQEKPEAIDAFFDKLPKHLAQDPIFVAHHCQYLMNQHQDVQAEAGLRQVLRAELNEQLLDLYGKLDGKVAKLSFVESLLKKHSHSASLYLCLGRLSRQEQLWGKAKLYLEASLQLAQTPVVYAELGGLLEQLGEENGALDMYRQGLSLLAKNAIV